MDGSVVVWKKVRCGNCIKYLIYVKGLMFLRGKRINK